MRRRSLWIGCLCLMMLAMLYGCAPKAQQTAESIYVPEADLSITTYGKVMGSHAVSLSFPVPVALATLCIREGERISPGQVIGYVNTAALVQHREALQAAYDILLEQEKGYAAKRDYLELCLLANLLQTGTNTPTALRSAVRAYNRAEEAYPDALSRLIEAQQAFEAEKGTQEKYHAAQAQAEDLLMDMEAAKQSIIDLKLNQRHETREHQAERHRLETEAYALSASMLENKTLQASQMALINAFEAQMKWVDMERGALIYRGEAGTVGKASCLEGQTIPANSEWFVAWPEDGYYIEVTVEEQLIEQVSIDCPVQIYPEAYRNALLKGTVSFISRRASLKNGESVFIVHIAPDAQDARLLLDANVKVKFLL